MKSRIDAFLRLMDQQGASDIHLSTGSRPMWRIDGLLEPMRYRVLTESDFESLVFPIIKPELLARFRELGDVDLAYEVEGLVRFRANIFRHVDGYGAVFRKIPTRISSMAELGLPAALETITAYKQGLVLITGPTGTGKTTTLAAMIDAMNSRENYNIITLENPIEFVHHSRRCVFRQREIGEHALSFASALKAAVREDPDVVLVGELRDLETIRMALNATETGLLVLSTLHTETAIKSVDRIINVFPPKEQGTVRGVLADNLRAVVSQQLIRRRDSGRVAVFEILLGSPALSNLIREQKTAQIINLIQTGRQAGMVEMDDAIIELWKEGCIADAEAYEAAISKDRMQKRLAELAAAQRSEARQPSGQVARPGSDADARREAGNDARPRPSARNRRRSEQERSSGRQTGRPTPPPTGRWSRYSAGKKPPPRL